MLDHLGPFLIDIGCNKDGRDSGADVRQHGPV
jgi:hypothetical protein